MESDSVTQSECEGSELGLFCFTVNGDDTLCLTNTPSDLSRDLVQLIEERWTVQQCQQSRQEIRVKLKGTPFKEGSSHKVSVDSRVLILQIFKFLHIRGWRPIVSADVSIDEDRTSVFFRLAAEPLASPDFDLVCLSPSSDSHIQLVNPSWQLVTALQRAALAAFPELTLKKMEESLTELVYEARLADGVWDIGEHQIGVAVRRFILELIAEFDSFEYRFYGTVNLKGIVDCLFFLSPKPKGPNLLAIKPNTTTNVKWKQRTPPPASKFWVLSLDRDDRVRVITSSSQKAAKGAEINKIIDTLRRTIATYWLDGIEKESEYFDSYELQLGGGPWQDSENKNGLAPRMLIAVVFEELLKIGWKVYCTVDITRDLNDKSIFVFHSTPPDIQHHFCLALDGYDKLRLVRYTIPVLE